MQLLDGVTGKFGLGIRNEAGKRLIEFCQENALVIANTLIKFKGIVKYHKNSHHSNSFLIKLDFCTEDSFKWEFLLFLWF